MMMFVFFIVDFHSFFLSSLTVLNPKDDEDSLNVAIAASRCVANVALVVRDQIVDHVLPVIQLNITQNEWEKKLPFLCNFSFLLLF